MKRRKIEMGVYIYTLRKNPTISIDKGTKAPVAIGVTKYAYKDSSYRSAAYNRMVGRMHALADKARDANPDLTLVTVGDPKDHDFIKYGPMGVYKVSDRMSYFLDTKAPGTLAGFIFKSGKSYIFEDAA